MDPKPHPSQGQLFELILYCGDSIPRTESIAKVRGSFVGLLSGCHCPNQGGGDYPGSMTQAIHSKRKGTSQKGRTRFPRGENFPGGKKPEREDSCQYNS